LKAWQAGHAAFICRHTSSDLSRRQQLLAPCHAEIEAAMPEQPALVAAATTSAATAVTAGITAAGIAFRESAAGTGKAAAAAAAT
jgi:hypothetical protein